MGFIKAWFIYLTTGWKCIEHFPTPENKLKTYIVCLKNNAVMEFNYSNFGGIYWFKHGIGTVHSENPIIFYKELPKPPIKSNG